MNNYVSLIKIYFHADIIPGRELYEFEYVLTERVTISGRIPLRAMIT